MREEVLQAIIGSMLETENLVQFIENATELVTGPDYMPAFTMDTFLYNTYVESTKRALKAIEGSVRTLSANQNIAMGKAEIMRPDFLLMNEDQQLIVIELKSQAKTEREAITELMAYTQEIRNMLPFVSHYDVFYVLVATDYTPLLKHAIGQLLLSSSVNLLCLRPTADGKSLAIYYPDSWSDLYSPFDPSFFRSMTLVLEESPGKVLANPERVIDNAVDLLTTEAIRMNAHGFCLVWRSDFGPYCITIYQLSPYVMFEWIQPDIGMNVNGQLYQELRRLADAEELMSTPESLFRIAETGKAFLERFFDVLWEADVSWVSQQDISRGAPPVYFSHWGIVDQFIKMYYYHPRFSAQLFPEFLGALLYPSDPLVSLVMLNYLTDSVCFSDGEFSPSDVFKFGLKIGLVIDYIRSDVADRALWPFADVLAGYFEVRGRAALTDAGEPPPPISLDLNQELADSLDAYYSWFIKSFLNNDPLYTPLFVLALEAGVVLDSNFRKWCAAYNEELLEKQEERLVTYARTLLGSMLDTKTDLTPDARSSITDVFGSCNLVTIMDSATDDVSTFYSKLLTVLDSAAIGLFHDIELDHFNFASADWNYLEMQARKRRALVDEYVAIQLNMSNGQVAVVQLPDDERNLRMCNDNEVYVRRVLPGSIVVVDIHTWDKLRSRGVSGSEEENF